MTKLTVQIDRMCVVELATARDLVAFSDLYPHGFRFPDGRVVFTEATAGRGQLVRITDGMKRTRYVRGDTMFEVIGDFDDLVFVEPPA